MLLCLRDITIVSKDAGGPDFISFSSFRRREKRSSNMKFLKLFGYLSFMQRSTWLYWIAVGLFLGIAIDQSVGFWDDSIFVKKTVTFWPEHAGALIPDYEKCHLEAVTNPAGYYIDQKVVEDRMELMTQSITRFCGENNILKCDYVVYSNSDTCRKCIEDIQAFYHAAKEFTHKHGTPVNVHFVHRKLEYNQASAFVGYTEYRLIKTLKE